MSRKLSLGLVFISALALLGLAWWSMVGRASAAPTPQAAPTGEPVRERDGNPDAPLISFIDSPSPECYRPEQFTDSCYINWQYLNVSASSSQYIISMTVNIDNQIRAYYSGFFQASMTIPGDMQAPGFRVACGVLGAGGHPQLGNAYAYTIRARETGGLKSANYGTVYCPADVVPVKQASLIGPAEGVINQPYSFTASSQATATLPVTYTWTVTGKGVITASNGGSNAQTFTWSNPGVKQVQVLISNEAGSATVTRNITITAPGRIAYLPVILKKGVSVSQR